MCCDLLVAEAIQRLLHRSVSAMADETEEVRPKQITCEARVARGDRVADRSVDVVVAGLPRRRPPVQLRLELWLGPAKLSAQHLGE